MKSGYYIEVKFTHYPIYPLPNLPIDV